MNKKLSDQVELMVCESVGVDIPDALAKEIDKTAVEVSAYIENIKDMANEFLDILNDVSARLEEVVADEEDQELLRRLDKVIDGCFDLTK